MKQSSVGAFARVARWVASAAVALVLGAATLQAQSTGKLEGRVRDQQGQPIANASVVIVGTTFNALTNAQAAYGIYGLESRYGTTDFDAIRSGIFG